MAEAITAYCLSLKQKVEVEQPRLEQTKNGRYMLKGIAKGTDKKVSKFVSSDEYERLRGLIGAAA